MILTGLLIIQWFSLTENIKDNIAVNFIIVAIIYVLHQISAQYKNINNTKLHKSIVYKYKFWQRQSLFGTSTFSEDIGLAASQSLCRDSREPLLQCTYTCTEWRNSTRSLLASPLRNREGMLKNSSYEECGVTPQSIPEFPLRHSSKFNKIKIHTHTLFIYFIFIHFIFIKL